jgi:anti-anti-sigma regulatory factor
MHASLPSRSGSGRIATTTRLRRETTCSLPLLAGPGRVVDDDQLLLPGSPLGRQEQRRPRRVTVDSRRRWGGSEQDSSPSGPDPGPGAVLRTEAGVPVVVLSGPVDRELIVEEVDPMLQLLTLEHDGPIVIDVSGVDAVNGALLGLLLRVNRRLAWRNRQLIIACSHPEHSRRLRISGLDELATLVEPG